MGKIINTTSFTDEKGTLFVRYRDCDMSVKFSDDEEVPQSKFLCLTRSEYQEFSKLAEDIPHAFFILNEFSEQARRLLKTHVRDKKKSR